MKMPGNHRRLGRIAPAPMLLGLLLLATGCYYMVDTESKKVTLDPRAVAGIEVRLSTSSCRALYSERAILDRCVQELNSLSYRRARRGGIVTDKFAVCYDKAGLPILQLGLGYPLYFEVTLPGSDPFYIQCEPMPTIGRLFTHMLICDALKGLNELAAKSEWSEEDRRIAGLHASAIGLRWPAIRVPPPQDPESLRAALNNLPPATLERLHEYKDEAELH